MNRKKKTISATETLTDLVALLPWWGACLLAVLGYALLHYWASQVAGDAPGPVLGPSLWATLAGFGQYAVPVVCLPAAGVSYWHRRRAIESIGLPAARQPTPHPDLDGMTLVNIELLLSESFRLQDFTVTDIRGEGVKEGADITLTKNGQTFLVQCKHWADEEVGADAVSELQALIARNRAGGGFAVTTGSFSSDAMAYAERAQLTLIDGPALQGMIEQTQMSRQSCPNCDRPMLRRHTRLGSGHDTAFWACSGFPVCRGTRTVLPPLT